MSLDQLENKMAAVDDKLMTVVHSDVQVLDEASKHIISSGGKRVRPRLMFLIYLASGGDNLDPAVNLSSAIELVHTATLVHDDINDHSDFRRGKVAVHARFGRTFALLTGDYLFTKVYELMAPYGNPYNVIMADACVKLVEGETLQAQAAKTGEIDREVYKTIIAKKTASLFEAAAHMGAELAGQDPETTEELRMFGYNLGMTFQLVDDILDVTGSAEELGKPVGLDMAQGRGVFATENGNGHSNGHAAVAEAPVAVLDDDDPVKRMMQRMIESGAIEMAKYQAQEMANRARKNLDVLPESPAKDQLYSLIDLVLNRSK